jgi:hypothetical protein
MPCFIFSYFLYCIPTKVLVFFLLFSPVVAEYVLRIWHGVGGSVDGKIATTVYILNSLNCASRRGHRDLQDVYNGEHLQQKESFDHGRMTDIA